MYVHIYLALSEYTYMCVHIYLVMVLSSKIEVLGTRVCVNIPYIYAALMLSSKMELLDEAYEEEVVLRTRCHARVYVFSHVHLFIYLCHVFS